jgi:indole-3-glycerol phosphate synthase
MTILQKIVDYKKQELDYIRRRVSLKDLMKKVGDNAPARSFLKNFDDGINIIAEVKKASPSAGVIREDFDPVEIARVYVENGARALSVLTDEHFFQGHIDYLRRIREKLGDMPTALPLLRKDFTLGEYHVFEARASGADAVLLIVSALDKFQLKDYRRLAIELGMSALVEVHDRDDLDTAISIGAELIGINNRDLKTFKTDPQTTIDLMEHLGRMSKPPCVISESGLRDRETLLDLKGRGVKGFLIGESLMREKDFGKKLRELACPSK